MEKAKKDKDKDKLVIFYNIIPKKLLLQADNPGYDLHKIKLPFRMKTPKKLLLQVDNPGYDLHKIRLPFRMITVGSSESGKTSTLSNFIKLFNNTFTTITICIKNANQPLYKYLSMKISQEFGLDIIEGLENLPILDSFKQN